MPELPEVETVRRGLWPIVSGAVIQNVKLGNKGLRFPFPFGLAYKLENRTIVDLQRRGKYLLFYLDDSKIFLSHLGMSGSWRSSKGSGACLLSKNQLHDHIIFDLLRSHDNTAAQLIYNDPRRFGFVDVFDRSSLDNHANLCKLGVEPLSDALTVEYLLEAFSKKKGPIKNILLDQSVVAGLGNIYVCEVLFKIALSPFKAAHHLSRSTGENKKLLYAMIASIKDTLLQAIEAGGSTLKDHIKTDGSLGYFQHNFAVYGKENASCPRCQSIIARVMMAGRATFYCTNCQV